jgi:hypothetical protein
MTHTTPPPIPPTFGSMPQFIEDGRAFFLLPTEIQQAVFRHWRWCVDHDHSHGHGLVGHYNWLRLLWEEEAEDAEVVPGVRLNGAAVRRSDW